MSEPEIELKALSPSDGALVYRMLQNIPKMENGFYNLANGLKYDEYKKWLQRQEDISNGIDIEEGMVPQTIYWLLINHIPVGIGKLRHELTPALRKTGGNIGYSIEPRYRGNGYGKLLLKCMLEEAKKKKITEIIISAYSYNIRSIHVALANGAVNYKKTDVKHFFRINL